MQNIFINIMNIVKSFCYFVLCTSIFLYHSQAARTELIFLIVTSEIQQEKSVEEEAVVVAVLIVILVRKETVVVVMKLT